MKQSFCFMTVLKICWNALINLKNLDIDKLRSDYNALYTKKESLQKTYKSAEKDIQSLNRKLDNLNQYLDRVPNQEQTLNRKPEKDSTMLWFLHQKRCTALKFFTSLRYTLMCVIIRCNISFHYSFPIQFNVFSFHVLYSIFILYFVAIHVIQYVM